MPETYRVCTLCKDRKYINEFSRDRRYKNGKHSQCKKCLAIRTMKSNRKRRKSDPRYRLWCSSRANHVRKGVEHNISVEDIPTPKYCIYLGIKLNYDRTGERGRLRVWDAPSIDRIDPSRGYVVGNIQVISDLANRMKSNATIEQLLAFAEGVIRVHGEEKGS